MSAIMTNPVSAAAFGVTEVYAKCTYTNASGVTANTGYMNGTAAAGYVTITYAATGEFTLVVSDTFPDYYDVSAVVEKATASTVVGWQVKSFAVSASARTTTIVLIALSATATAVNPSDCVLRFALKLKNSGMYP